MHISVEEERIEICGWPTDCFHLDYYDSTTNKKVHPHTVLMFIPGNPGCSGWYIQLLKIILHRLGVGYAARAVSYAGHGIDSQVVLGSANLNDDGSLSSEGRRSPTGKGVTKESEKTAWTINGQIDHKIEWVDLVTMAFVNDRLTTTTDVMVMNSDIDGDATTDYSSSSTALPEFVFISHSIGAHLVQRLCILRMDILVRTRALIHLMPFFRFDPYPRWKKTYLSTVANAPDLAIRILRLSSRIASFLPTRFIDSYLENIVGIRLVEDREIARKLFTSPEYARNFLMLGLEEIRDVPEKHDIGAMTIIGVHSPSYILYCGNEDQWAPRFHMDEISHDISTGVLPKNISLDYADELQHDFVVHPEMHERVVDFACKSIFHSNSLRAAKETKTGSGNSIQLKSKL